MILFICTNIEEGGMLENNKQNEKNYRTTRFTIRLNKEEHEEFIKKAKKKGMTISEYLRYLVKKDK